MLLAMGITAFLCIAIGVYPAPLYALLPFDVSYASYTTTHVITQLQLLFFSALAFTVLMRTGIYPPELKSVNLDTDWTYRKAGPWLLGHLSKAIAAIWGGFTGFFTNGLKAAIAHFYRSHGPEGRIAHIWPTGSMVLWLAIILGVTLLVVYTA